MTFSSYNFNIYYFYTPLIMNFTEYPTFFIKYLHYRPLISNFCKFQIAKKIQPLAYSSLTSESAFASFSFSPLPPF